MIKLLKYIIYISFFPPTFIGDILYRKSLFMRHEAKDREDDDASVDGRERVNASNNQTVPGNSKGLIISQVFNFVK